MSRLVLLGSIILFALGCSSDDDEQLTASTFCDRWAEAACTADTLEVCQAPDAEACQVSQATYCLGLLPDNFAPDQARGCLQAVENAYSDGRLNAEEMQAVLRMEGACGNLSSGAVNEGGTCSQRAQCNTAEGYECVFKGTETSGTCQLANAVGAGERCTEPGDTCGEGFYCDGTNCVAGKPVGEDCSLTRECDTDSFCSEGTCTARLERQENCEADQECASGICYDFTPDGEDICVDLVVLTLSEPICDNLS